jgi:hypothetical protein
MNINYNNYNNFKKYNSRIKKFITSLNGGNLNIQNNKLLDKDNKELKPYEKRIESKVELDELLYFQNNVLPNLQFNGMQLDSSDINDSFNAIAGGSYSTIFYVKSQGIEVVIKVQDNDKLSDVENYLKIKKNDGYIPQEIIKIYGIFKSFDKFESYDPNIIYNNNVKYNKPLSKVYILFENADGNIRELTKYLYDIKKSDYQKWVTVLKKFILTMLNGLKYLHLNVNNKFALIHMDLRPENIVYIKHNNEYIFKIIDIGSAVEYQFDKTNIPKERLRGSGVYNKYVYKNSLFRDYYNLWLTICETFDLFDFKAYKQINERSGIRDLVSKCHKQSEILSQQHPNFLEDMFGNEKDSIDLIQNLSNLKNSINVFRKIEKLNTNISRDQLLEYINKFV